MDLKLVTEKQIDELRELRVNVSEIDAITRKTLLVIDELVHVLSIQGDPDEGN